MNQSRRSFIRKSALASTVFGTFSICGTKSSGKIIGANDRINVAVCGIKGRGASHIGGLGRQKNVVISHLVDPDSSLYDGRKKFVSSKFKNTPDCVQDVRKVLDNNEVDAISIATPNHWHSLMSIWACQAGKDAMSRNLSVTTSSKDGNWSKQPRNTGASFSTARKTAPSRNGPTKLRKLPPASTASSRLLSEPVTSAVVPSDSRTPKSPPPG